MGLHFLVVVVNLIREANKREIGRESHEKVVFEPCKGCLRSESLIVFTRYGFVTFFREEDAQKVMNMVSN